MSGTKPGRKPNPVLQRTSPIVLPRTRSGTLRIGCLSWSQDFTEEPRWLSAGELVRSLELLQNERPFTADLILCSGAAIWDDGTTSDQIFRAAGGTAVLSEWRDNEGDPAAWWVASAGGWEQVRHEQYVRYANEVSREGSRTLAEIANGWGTITFDGVATKLVLLICNEARILSRDPSMSIVERAQQPNATIPPVFRGSWALLHPSHRPYGSRSVHRGWGLVGRTRRKGVHTAALFCDVTAHPLARGGKTRAPRAVFHAGPWQHQKPLHQRVAGCVFRDGQRRKSRAPLLVPGLVNIRYAEFPLKLKGKP